MSYVVYISHHHQYHRLCASILLSVRFVLQLFVVDLLDIGLLKVTEAAGRRRLNETIAQLSDVIRQGLTGTVNSFHFSVTSLRQCVSGDGINDGCSSGTVLAAGCHFPPNIGNGGTGAPGSIIHWLLVIVAFLFH